jgi:phage terminase large subunit-like protein
MAQAACSRQLLDLERAAKGWDYEFDEGLAGRACRFLELLPHVKGHLAGQTLVLEPWQCFVVCTAFGWVRRGTRRRRFRRVTIFVPRGNGKSCLSSGVGLYCLAADGEGGAEVYSAATTRDQARIVFGDAQSMVKRSLALRERLGLESMQHSIVQESSNSSFKALSREADNLDGLNVHCAVIDEIHAHKTRDIYDVLETGLGKRLNSILWVISTAGSDTSGIGYEVYGYAKRILTKTATDESLFAAIWEADEGDDWTAEATWRKANPNWGVSVQPEILGQLAAKAQQIASAQSAFATKHLNRWTNADQQWMDLGAWDRCADPEMQLEAMVGEECVIGLDLASKTDIAAKALVFARDIDGKRHYRVFCDCYLPESRAAEGGNSQYRGWQIEGRLRTTPGEVLDFATLQADVLADRDRFRVREVAYDPWQALKLSQELTDAGMTCVEMRPSVQNFSPAMKEFEALVRSGRLLHDGNPVLRWMVSNVVARPDAQENLYPRKDRPENKIDGVVALLMALGRSMVSESGTTSCPYTETDRLL